MNDIELKSIIEDIINKFLRYLDIEALSETIFNEIRISYDIGLNRAEDEFNMNFTRDPARLQTLQKYTFDNIRGMNNNIAESLRKELTQGLLNNESISKIKDRVKKVMDVSTERSIMIARTETNRAENMGHLDAARQSGLKLYKQWDAHLDTRTSEVCRDLDGITIPLDSKFKWNGKEFDAPPAHPNCRSVLIFIQK